MGRDESGQREPKVPQERDYEAPAITELGSVEALSAGTSSNVDVMLFGVS